MTYWRFHHAQLVVQGTLPMLTHPLSQMNCTGSGPCCCTGLPGPARLSPEIPAGTEIPGGGGGAALYRTLHVTTQLTVVRQVVMVCFGGGSALSLAEWESEEAVCKLQEVGNFVRQRTRADRTEY